MTQSSIEETITQSLAGTITFPQVVAKLLAAGVRSYHVDLIQGENRYYLKSDKTYTYPVSFAHSTATQSFSATQVIAAIKAIQKGEINYQEFLDQILAAGTVYYIAYLQGKKVIYFGRDGDLHVEVFPQPK